MTDATTPEPRLNRAGRRAESRRLRKTGALMAAIPAAFGTTALALAATSGTVGAAGPLVVNTLGDAGDGTCDVTCTLRDAVDTAVDGDTIEFDAALAGSTITLTDGALDVDTAVTIAGPGAALLTVAADADYRIFDVDVSTGTEDVTISGLTLTGGSITNLGGAIYVFDADVFTLSGIVAHDNTSSSDGGAVFVPSSSTVELVVADSLFEDNSAGEDGGAISVYNASSVSITGTTFRDNIADSDGGAIYLWDIQGPIVVTGSTFDQNSATYDGGGLSIWYARSGVTISASTFSGNSAGSDGGGLQASYTDSPASITGSTFTANHADDNGGGAYVYFASQLDVTSTTFAGNSAGGEGGGLAVYGAPDEESPDSEEIDITISGSSFVGNDAGTSGGGLAVDESHSLAISFTTFADNSAQGFGGAIYADDVYLAATIENTTISGNSTAQGGGGLAMFQLPNGMTIYNSTISGNTAAEEGGGIYVGFGYYIEGSGVLHAPLTVVQSTIVDNVATTIGGIAMVDIELDAAAADRDVDEQRDAGPRTNPNGGARAHEGDGAPVRSGEFSSDADTITLSGTIVALNSGADIGDFGALKTTGSLLGNVTGITLDDQGGNLMGVDPLLGPLQDNGGPTRTHALLDGSPAINAGPDPVASFPGNADDQRGPGYPRVIGGRVDIGAFEAQPSTIEPDFTG